MLQRNLRLAELESEYDTFANVQLELDTADENGIYARERLQIKHEYIRCRARAQDLLQPTRTTAAPEAIAHASKNGRKHVSRFAEGARSEYMSLLSVQLPQFKGRYENWPGFADQFRATIRENSHLSEKLTYLRSCLHGEPAESIESLANSSANYQGAWELLNRLYNKPAIIAANHIQALFNMPAVARGNHREIRNLLTRFEAHYRALQSLEQPSADTLLIHLVLSRLDSETNIKWREQLGNIQFPKLQEFFDFLHDRCNHLEPSSLMARHPRNEQPPTPQDIKTLRVNHIQTPSRVYATQVNVNCHICNQNHATYTCEKLLKATVIDRIKLVREQRLCANCLRKGHSPTECRSGACRVCQRKHNTLLHSDKTTETQTPPQVHMTCLKVDFETRVLLATAKIDILDRTGPPPVASYSTHARKLILSLPSSPKDCNYPLKILTCP